MEFIADLLQRVHVSALPVKMHWQQRPDFVRASRSKASFDQSRIHIQRVRIYIDKHWPCSGPHDRASRGEETEGRSNDRVAGLDPGSHQRKPERIRPRRAADGGAGAGEGRDFAFQSFNFGTQDELLRGADPLNSGQHFSANLLVLPMQIQ